MKSRTPTPAFLRHVLERSVAAIAIEPVGKPAGWQTYKIIQAVVVEVSDGHAVVSVNVDADGAVENRPPIIGSVKQLLFVGVSLSERP